MSVQITECDVCGTEFEYGHQPGYCSEECYHRNAGDNFLQLLKHDHRFCHSDFKRLKEIERPTDEQLRQIDGIHSSECVVGFQYKTSEADVGEITAKPGVQDTVVTGIICSCGVTDHKDDYLRNLNPIEAAKRLRNRVIETRLEGQHDYAFDEKTFVEAWNESKDWTLALGRALQ